MKVGIAGAGFMGEVHAQCYQKMKDVELLAVAEQNSLRLEKFVKSFSPAKTYSNIMDMIKDDEIDVVDICLPTPIHPAVSIAALQRDKNVLLEKPIALNIADARKIQNAAEASKGKFMVAHVLRFWAEYSVIRNLLQNHQLGDIKEIYAARFNELPLWSEGAWIMEEDQSGGLVIDLMIHDIDFILWNLGKAKRVWCNGIRNEKGFAVQVMAVLEFEDGKTAYVEGGYLNPAGSGLTTQMRIYGKEALLEMYSHNNEITLTGANGKIANPEIPAVDGYFEEIAYFINCIKQDKEPAVVTTRDAVESLQVCLALKQALKSKQWIEIE